MIRLRSLAVSVFALLAGLGCTLDSVISSAGVPGTTLDATISEVKTRGSYLDARVVAGGFDYRFFFPDSEPCRYLLEGSGRAQFQWLAVLGRLSDADHECDAVGVLSLRAWRDRQPRRSREPLERAPASYDVIYRDADQVQLEGRFPLASRLGFTGTARLVVVVPNDETCRPVIESNTSSMEFRASGPKALVLIAKSQLCTVLGIAQPI